MADFGKRQPAHKQLPIAAGYLVRMKNNSSIAAFSSQKLCSVPRIINPCLLPLFCSRIIRVETLAGIGNAVQLPGAGPLFQDHATVQD